MLRTLVMPLVELISGHVYLIWGLRLSFETAAPGLPPARSALVLVATGVGSVTLAKLGDRRPVISVTVILETVRNDLRVFFGEARDYEWRKRRSQLTAERRVAQVPHKHGIADGGIQHNSTFLLRREVGTKLVSAAEGRHIDHEVRVRICQA
jgi:hypothetical protein